MGRDRRLPERLHGTHELGLQAVLHEQVHARVHLLHRFPRAVRTGAVAGAFAGSIKGGSPCHPNASNGVKSHTHSNGGNFSKLSEAPSTAWSTTRILVCVWHWPSWLPGPTGKHNPPVLRFAV